MEMNLIRKIIQKFSFDFLHIFMNWLSQDSFLKTKNEKIMYCIYLPFSPPLMLFDHCKQSFCTDYSDIFLQYCVEALGSALLEDSGLRLGHSLKNSSTAKQVPRLKLNFLVRGIVSEQKDRK